jgi:hypothetical protein
MITDNKIVEVYWEGWNDELSGEKENSHKGILKVAYDYGVTDYIREESDNIPISTTIKRIREIYETSNKKRTTRNR